MTHTHNRSSPQLAWQWLSFDELTATQLYGLLRLRQDVFVLEQQCLYLDIDGLDLHARHCFGRGASGELAAYLRVIPPQHNRGETRIARVIVAPDHRGKGLGWALMREALAYSRARFPNLPIQLSAQAHLERFYNELGFERVGARYDDYGIPHYDMRLHAKQPAEARAADLTVCESG